MKRIWSQQNVLLTSYGQSSIYIHIYSLFSVASWHENSSTSVCVLYIPISGVIGSLGLNIIRLCIERMRHKYWILNMKNIERWKKRVASSHIWDVIIMMIQVHVFSLSLLHDVFAGNRRKTHRESIFKQEREQDWDVILFLWTAQREVLWGMCNTNCLRATKGGLAQRIKSKKSKKWQTIESMLGFYVDAAVCMQFLYQHSMRILYACSRLCLHNVGL